MEFKGTKTEWEVVEHNWRETSICSNGKTICSFELDDIEEEDLTENDLTEEENVALAPNVRVLAVRWQFQDRNQQNSNKH